MNNPEFSPRKALERALARWWVIVLLTVAGGLIGGAFHFFQPPIYEATATLTIDMDFTKRELTQYEEDHAFNAAGAIIASTKMKKDVVDEGRKQGWQIADVSAFRREAMSSEREQSIWKLHVRDADPQLAAAMVNIWAAKAHQALQAALRHALRAEQIQDQIDAITGQATSGSDPEAQASLQKLTDELAEEDKSAGGVLASMTYAPGDAAEAPERPVLYGVGGLVLAGACVGFFVSLWAVNSFKVRRRD